MDIRKLFITLACQTIWIHILRFNKKQRKKKERTERMREYLIYLFRYTTCVHLVSLLLKSWIFGFTFVIELIRMDLLLLVFKQPPLIWEKNHSTVSLCVILFSALLLFSTIFKIMRVVLIRCRRWWWLALHEIYWFGLNTFWGHTVTMKLMRYIKRIDSSSYVHVWIGIWCVFDKSIGLILNDF